MNLVKTDVVFNVLVFVKTTFFVSESPVDDNSSAALLCVQCKDAFQNAWDLMVHAQAAHMLNIYELGVPRLANCTSPSLSPRDTPDKVMNEITCLRKISRSIIEYKISLGYYKHAARIKLYQYING